LDEAQWRFRIDFPHLIEACIVERFDALEMGHPCIVDQGIDTSMLSQCRVHPGSIGCAVVGVVAVAADSLVLAQVSSCRDQVVAVTAAEAQAPAIVVEGRGDREADAPVGTCDHGNPIIGIEHLAGPPIIFVA
jgi:hypothetical protein